MSAKLLPVDEAKAILLQSISGCSLEKESISLATALGRVLASDVISLVDVPPADNSAMDGYCFRLQDLKDDTPLPVSQRIPAGSVATPLEPGTAARIFTGAEIPATADVVVMQENTQLVDGAVLIKENPNKSQNIRPQGQDISTGQVVLEQGHRLRPQDMGLLASIGVAHVEAYRPLTIAILSTGDEIIEPGQPLQTGQIFNSNRYTLLGLIAGLGMNVLDIGVVEDDLAATEKALTQASEADVIISTGGVSVGEEDHVKDALDRLGEVSLWKLAIKPGKPFTYGHVLDTPFLGLPGNPAAVLMTFCVLCRPWLLKFQGATELEPLTVIGSANFSTKKPAVRQQYLQARLLQCSATNRVETFPNQSSGMLSSAAWANGVAVVPAHQLIEKGDNVQFIPYDGIV
jgi:molybdopterin molybdotransferase